MCINAVSAVEQPANGRKSIFKQSESLERLSMNNREKKVRVNPDDDFDYAFCFSLSPSTHLFTLNIWSTLSSYYYRRLAIVYCARVRESERGTQAAPSLSLVLHVNDSIVLLASKLDCCCSHAIHNMMCVCELVC